jgi:hypothetical protein
LIRRAPSRRSGFFIPPDRPEAGVEFDIMDREVYAF